MNWKHKQLQNRGPPKRRGPSPMYACEDDRANAHRAASAQAMRRYRARLKEMKRLAEALAEAPAEAPIEASVEASVEASDGHRLNHRATKAALCTRVCCTEPNRAARFVIISRSIEEYTNSVCDQGGNRVAQRVALVHQAQPRGQCVRLTTHNIYTDYKKNYHNQCLLGGCALSRE